MIVVKHPWWGLALLGLLACGTTAQQGRFVYRVGSSPGGKHVDVYADESYRKSESAQLSPEFVDRAMRSSSYFQDDDIRALVGPIVEGISRLDEDQHLVVSGGGGIDPPSIHFFVQDGELQIVRYRGGVEQARHTALIPKATVAVDLPDAHRAAPTPVTAPPEPKPEPKPDPVVAAPPVTPPVVAEPTPAPATAKKGKKKDKDKKVEPDKGKHLSPEEVHAKLQELERLKAKGLISDQDYARKRRELLDQL